MAVSSFRSIATLLLPFCALLSIQVTYAAEWSKLKICSDLGFCRRHRHFSATRTRYLADPSSITASLWRDLPAVRTSLHSSAGPNLLLIIVALANGIFRVVIDDVDQPKHPRHFVEDVILNQVAPLNMTTSHISLTSNSATVQHPESPSTAKIVITFDPFTVELYSVSSNFPRVQLNSQSRLLVDSFHQDSSQAHDTTSNNQDKLASSDDAALQSDSEIGESTDQSTATASVEPGASPDISTPAAHVCDGCGSEQFKEHTDPKLRGPESVGLDISFPYASDVYGIPERTTSFSLEDTMSNQGEAISEPYRLYNLDIFEFELDKPLGLYGAIPFLHTRNKKDSVGVLWLNSAETYVDVSSSQTGKSTHWYSETGVIDVFLLPGPSSPSVYEQYIYLTGAPAMPQRFALGYHQCRWNYRDDPDVRAVDAEFDKHDIPYDALWLDIEHTDGKRYFTWDKERFPDPTALQEHIASRGRKMVTIVDPHVKRDKKYFLHQLGTRENLYVKNPDGKDYDAWCWPGSSSYFDFTFPRVRQLFASMFHSSKYPHFSKTLHIWNDMNEPSVFNGPEGTMPKDRLHHGNVEHRHVHNIYGHFVMQATFEGVRAGHGGDNRPFVLSRSFYAGSQRFGAIWTGDNAANWEHLESSIRMLLPLQISAVVFSGADVGGFFGNPEPDLLTRWYQAGAFQPFFRGHAHLDSNRREPWLFGEPYTTIIATAIRTRYQFLPLWYTLMAENHLLPKLPSVLLSTGSPMRPLWWEFPDDERSDKLQTQWMVGNALLVAPIMKKDVQMHSFYAPPGERWYDLFSSVGRGEPLKRTGDAEIPVSLDRMVVLQRGGTIIPTQERRRRSSVSMLNDPFTLLVALDKNRKSSGNLYVDDGESYKYEDGHYVLQKFNFDGRVLRSKILSGGVGEYECSSFVERVVIFGYGEHPPASITHGNKNLEFVHSPATGALTIQRSRLAIGTEEWEVVIG